MNETFQVLAIKVLPHRNSKCFVSIRKMNQMSNHLKRERSAQYLTKKKFEHKLNDMLLDFAT